MAISFPPSRPRARRAPAKQRPSGFRTRQPSAASAPPERLRGRQVRRRRPSFMTQPVSPQTTRFRLVVVWIILLLGMLALTLNLFRIQIIQASVLQERAKAQQTISLGSIAPRRPIVDRAGNVLAVDKPVYTLYVHPILFKETKETIAVALSTILNQPVDALLAKFNSGESGIRIVDMLAEDRANQVTRLEFDGLELIQQQQRLYPQQDLFAEVVGYVNVDRKGQSGVESSEEDELTRSVKTTELSRSGDGSVIPIGLPENFLQRDDLRLQLTVDSRLQRAARTALKQQMKKYNAKRGTVMVMDVKDGGIVSLASEPSYDPNKYYQADQEHLRNWVVTDVYEPGSTFKPVNVSIALESGAVKPNDYFVDEGAIQIGEWPIQNSDYDSMGGRGPISVTEILQYSSNVGMVHVMQRLKAGVYYGWLERLGIDKPTGTDLPFEVAGQIKSYDQFTGARIEPATTAFGQGFSLTPIKLLQLEGMVANGGKMLTPHVVQGLYTADGKPDWQPKLSQPRQIFSPDTTKAVLKMMEQVVLEGTGKPAQIPGYRIAGKTGTAQKAGPNGGYIRGARITSFVGILPAEAPRYVVLAVVDEPQGDDAYGSTVAAPIAKTVMEALIATEQITPSDPEKLKQNRDEVSQAQPSDGDDQASPRHLNKNMTEVELADEITQDHQDWVENLTGTSDGAGNDTAPDAELR